jgi:hypothetical protein
MVAEVLSLAALVARALVPIVAVAGTAAAYARLTRVLERAVKTVIAFASVRQRWSKAFSALRIAGTYRADLVEGTAFLWLTLALSGDTGIAHRAGIAVPALQSVGEI